jgi:hypothetical protein
LFLAGCVLYVVNRWVLKPWLPLPVLHNWFNDFWLIPCALPPLLWVQSRLKLRSRTQPPNWREIFFHVAIWSLLFEWIGPHLVRHARGDWWDVGAYALGGIVAGCWWHREHVRLRSCD